jgi:hypothetical protein
MDISSNIAIYTATKANNLSFLLSDSLKRLNLLNFLHPKFDNSQPLAKVYNGFLDHALEKDFDYVVFTHDDVRVEHDFRLNLQESFETFDVVGVAGCSKAEIKSPALWHMMGQGHLHGAVAHTYGGKHKAMTSFGIYPHRVVMIDGVFIALNKKAIKTVRFDEECPSKWHFYDLNFSAICLQNNLKMGVGDIIITHESHGLSEISNDWKIGERYYLETYNS